MEAREVGDVGAEMEIASKIEHTLLQATATRRDVEILCEEARAHAFHGVCVNPLHVLGARQALAGSVVRVISVAGFPLGATLPEIVAIEARRAVTDGAHEIDVPIPLGLALEGNFDAVQAYLRIVRDAVPGVVLKAILETGSLSPAQQELATESAVCAGVEFIKTSTGHGPCGATVEDIEHLVRCAAGRVKVKASGGIRSPEQARNLLIAGAERLGTSCGALLVG